MTVLALDWSAALATLEWVFLLYFVGINTGYMCLTFVAFQNMRGYLPRRALDALPQVYSGHELPVSILVPAYNEEATIVATVKSMLQLDYPHFEIIVVNDASKDGTLEVLKREFDFHDFPLAYRNSLQTSPVRGFYQSARYDNLRLVDKENGGKADALNVGINTARYPLFCVVDADSILERHSINRILYPFLEDQRVVAVGGTIRLANGCNVSQGFLSRVDLPKNPLALLQVVEYLRAFLFGRLGWSAMGALLIISGAFGVFRREAVVSVGGFRRDTVGEDMELVVRMHRVLREQGRPYRMVFLPDPVAWTEVPEDLRTLKNQRSRWQRGLAESLLWNWRLMFSRNGGTPGWVAFPFMLVFELFGPVIEVTGFVLLLVLALAGAISWQVLGIFFGATVGMGLLISLTCLLLEELSFHVYQRPRQLAILMGMCVVENLGFRQLSSVLRIWGLLKWIFQRQAQWGEMRRKANWQQPR